VIGVVFALAAALMQSPPPFPRPSQTPPPKPATPTVQPPPAPAPSPAPQSTTEKGADQAPTEQTLGVPLYPGIQFLASYDAGRGQRFYLYGSTAPFLDVVAFYRTALKQKGELVFDAPATHQFDVGRFREETMAFPSGVTVKDFQSQISQGYPNPRLGGTPARFATVLQIVPVVEP
jgi:hypothetical protein